jgi:hypothetical protein
MGWFSKHEVIDAKPPETSATPAESIADRAEVARRHVTAIHDQLTQIDHEFRTFKTRHSITASKFGILLGCQCSFAERPKIEAQWKEMLRRRDKTVAAWHEALREWSTLKEQAKENYESH